MRFRAKGGGLAIAFATVASAVTLLVPAQSSAVTFGANLARTPGTGSTKKKRACGKKEEAKVRRNHHGDRG